jgi:predicted nuclease of restriction endonuclease-like (RecB) superfamily
MQDFKQLIDTIEQVHSHLQTQAAQAVNQALTTRNWLIGYYIVEFEQEGKDRAEYGEGLIKTLAVRLNHIKGMDERSCRRFRQLYLTYPHLGSAIWGTLSPELEKVGVKNKVSLLSDENHLRVPPEKIISRLSYSHIELLLNVDDSLKRTFYELECIKGTWSVRELKRQIGSLYYERSGLSAKPEKLAELVQKNSTPQVPTDIIKNIYAFEFLNLKTRDLVEESDLESALLDHIQDFIVELGNGFCFEARQKRILIGSTYYFIDLLFYHRILKCHVLLELKIGAFDHGDIGQLNTYLNYFRMEISEASDNPPVGILLVAEKDHALVKYATAGMDENLFVQQYLVQLPSTEQLQQYVEKELKQLT